MKPIAMVLIFVGGLPLVLTNIGCSSPVADSKESPAASQPDPRARALDLVIDDPMQDVTKLDDAALDASISTLNQQVNQLTAQLFQMATEPEGANLEANPAYRAKLRELKIAETQLGDLEMEQIRRQKAKR